MFEQPRQQVPSGLKVVWHGGAVESSLRSRRDRFCFGLVPMISDISRKQQPKSLAIIITTTAIPTTILCHDYKRETKLLASVVGFRPGPQNTPSETFFNRRTCSRRLRCFVIPNPFCALLPYTWEVGNTCFWRGELIHVSQLATKKQKRHRCRKLAAEILCFFFSLTPYPRLLCLFKKHFDDNRK